ncbi:MAG TPA: hypothetical protein VK586_23075 [Streptosporangiaceae bacterium]|nr:hypothetical protein [Streptosporangiaceae bacterium]
MFSNGRLAVRSTLAAGLAGLAMLAAAPALAATGTAAAPAIAPATAPAGSTTPAGAGSFKTWAAAQKAAGFTLYVPKETDGLKRTHNILVTRCTATTKVRFDVYAQWGTKTFMALDQNNSGAACSDFGAATFIKNYKISGVTYRLMGFCGRRGQPSCSSKAASLALTWKIGSRFNAAFSKGVLRGTLVSFATSIKKV